MEEIISIHYTPVTQGTGQAVEAPASWYHIGKGRAPSVDSGQWREYKNATHESVDGLVKKVSNVSDSNNQPSKRGRINNPINVLLGMTSPKLILVPTKRPGTPRRGTLNKWSGTNDDYSCTYYVGQLTLNYFSLVANLYLDSTIDLYCGEAYVAKSAQPIVSRYFHHLIETI